MYDTTAFRTMELTFPDNNWLTQLIASKTTEQYVKADLKFNGQVYKDVGVRARGASSFNAGRQNGKVPLKISFDEFVPGRKVLGMRSTILNNGYWSPTFMREVLVLGMMAKYVPTPRANWVNVVINGSNRGVYINVETPNKDFLGQFFEEDDGNRYTGQTNLQYRGTNPASYPPYYPLVSSTVPNPYVDLIQALQTTTLTGQQAFDQIPKLCNVEGSMKIMALNVAFSNGDAYPRHNYYIYMDPLNKQMEIIPWDVNLSFRRTTATFSPTFFTHADLWRRWYLGHLRDIAEQELDWNKILPQINTWQALIDTAVRNDPLKFYSYADFKNGLTQATINIFPFGLKQSIEGLRQSILAGVSGPRVDLTNHVRTPNQPGPTDAVWINVTAKATGTTVANVNLHWRNYGNFKSISMFDDGQHRDGQPGDGIYGVEVPFRSPWAKVQYYISAETGSNLISFLPLSTDHNSFAYAHPGPIQNSIVLHEVMASNTSGIKDEKGEFEDWVELHNPQTTTVDISGMYLSDDRTNLTRWQIPNGIKILPGNSLVIWADDEPNDGPLHATFKLGSGGEAVYLTDKDGMTMLDFIEFASQQDDVSIARLRDRVGAPWVTDFTPTPGSANELRGGGIRRFATFDQSLQPMRLDLSGAPKIATNVSIDLTSAPANSPVLFMVGADIAHFPFQPLGIHLLVGSVGLSLTVPGNATGAVSLPVAIPNDPNLDGARLVMQALSVDGGKVVDSNALQLQVHR